VFLTSPRTSATVQGSVAVNVWIEKQAAGTNRYTLAVAGRTLTLTSGGPHVTFVWDSRTAPNGRHALTATVTDAAGKTGTATVEVTISN
jgi:hypothetical protein